MLLRSVACISQLLVKWDMKFDFRAVLGIINSWGQVQHPNDECLSVVCWNSSNSVHYQQGLNTKHEHNCALVTHGHLSELGC